MPSESNSHTQTFSAHRDALFGIAYRMLGSRADAEDVVQATWLRWSEHADDVEFPTSWLSRTTARLAIDTCKKAYRRREEYVGPWLPEPLYDATRCALTEPQNGKPQSPEHAALFRESVELGFLQCLELLGPLERAAYILREVYGLDYSELAETLERNEPACRKLVSRAGQKLRQKRSATAAPEEAQIWIGKLLQAVAADDVDAMKDVLLEDAVLLTDSDGKRPAARRPVEGADRVIAFISGLARQYSTWSIDLVESNGTFAIAVTADGRLESVIVPLSSGAGIERLLVYRNPAKFPLD
jgi:RNA polymerase sigma-70 factor (ECF subfamily)